MNVLHVHSGNLYGGVETFLLTLARSRELAPGMDMSVALCFEGQFARDLRATRMMPVMLGDVRLRRPDKVRRARQELRTLLTTHAFDIAVCHQAWPHAIFGSVIKAAGLPLVSWVHLAQTGGHWLDRLASRVEPDCYICNSKYTASLLSSTNARVEVVYAPVKPDASAFALTPRIASADRPDGRAVIIQVSRMENWKGQRVLLEALARLRDVPEWECWFVGGAQRPAEARYVDTLKAAAVALGIADRVRFLGQRSDVSELLASADIFCQANTEPEAFGISFVEALYAGIPVVTSSTGGALEIVDGTCGVLVPPDDAPALASALTGLLKDKPGRARLGRSGPARARALCDPATQMRHIAAVLESVAAMRVTAH
jgi:glycosyltransferase involved in cell wall biosynthesis